MTRQPAATRYDAFVGLEPRKPGETPRFAYALVKITYDVVRGRAIAGAPEPLASELNGAEPPEASRHLNVDP